MRLILLITLALLAAVTIGQGASLSCSDDSDCPNHRLCCHTEDDTGPFENRDFGVCAARCSVEETPRHKRSLGVLARALGTIIRRLARWYRSRGVGSTTSTGLRVITRRGGFRQANRDFDKFVRRSDIESVRPIPGVGRVAIGKDGYRMIVRQRSKDGRPTLELQNSSGKSIIKYRYEP
ncbi:hypothetical protein BOX15_Mlig025890g1 [Macrostomum lignano]|uniref:Uncharacterized protein n=1 Tax=Macrostomum lignano TaxID=282301 RepID=A0A267H7M3_9PLAT|nr:hypothetical protein BOX15_Mlig025890g1 [Macrostomum lignano]